MISCRLLQMIAIFFSEGAALFGLLGADHAFCGPACIDDALALMGERFLYVLP
jgi:hypothetical protein